MVLGNGCYYSYCLNPRRAVLEGSMGRDLPWLPCGPWVFLAAQPNYQAVPQLGVWWGGLSSFPRVLFQLTGEQRQMWVGRDLKPPSLSCLFEWRPRCKEVTYEAVSPVKEELCKKQSWLP